MVNDDLNKQYFEWMYNLVCNNEDFNGLSYELLLNHLNDIRYEYVMDIDSNREEDGIDLRYRFRYEHHYDSHIICSLLDDDCSVLEMLVALALRCEETIMDDPEIGNRTGKWFWIMMDNLGLSEMDDFNFDGSIVDDVISRFQRRAYKRNGEGGLFITHDNHNNMRTMEIWNQMCLYLYENFSD